MTDYDAEQEFENYLCFSAMLAQRTENAIDTLEQIDSDDSREYVTQVVDSVMKPLNNLMEHKIRKYPYTPENLSYILTICGGKESALKFLENQKTLQQSYYELLPLVMSKDEAEKEWEDIETLFIEQIKRLDGIDS